MASGLSGRDFLKVRLFPSSALASGFPGPRQDFQVHFGVQVRHLRPGSALASGFPGPRQDFQDHFRIAGSTSGFSVRRPSPLWPIKSSWLRSTWPSDFATSSGDARLSHRIDFTSGLLQHPDPLDTLHGYAQAHSSIIYPPINRAAY